MSSQAEAFADRVFASALGAIEIYSIHIGNELGFYKTMFEHESCTPDELASSSNIDPRYAKEWLEQQATSGIVEVVQSDGESRFSLPEAHAEVLADELNGLFLVPLARMLSTSGEKMESLLDAYRSGSGVSWDDFGQSMRESQADMNRPFFHNDLAGVVARIDSVQRLISKPGARVADVGTGAGWSAIALAKAYPDATFVGYDVDAPSIEMAKANAESAGVADRVEFTTQDVTEVDENFDVAFAFECVHDMPQPVPVLAGMRSMIGDDGVAVIMDEAVGDQFSGAGDDIERLMYGFSLLICLPDGLSSAPSVGTGTVMRPSTLKSYADQAGFGGFKPLTEAGFFRFYELSP